MAYASHQIDEKRAVEAAAEAKAKAPLAASQDASKTAAKPVRCESWIAGTEPVAPEHHNRFHAPTHQGEALGDQARAGDPTGAVLNPGRGASRAAAAGEAAARAATNCYYAVIPAHASLIFSKNMRKNLPLVFFLNHFCILIT
jgi:hypothetical protein